jgi:hypothetical protein
MGATDDASRAVVGVADAMRSQPLALALVIINLLFLGAGGFFLHELGIATVRENERRDDLIADLAKRCLAATPPASKNNKEDRDAR